jgi:hypothetical protein
MNVALWLQKTKLYIGKCKPTDIHDRDLLREEPNAVKVARSLLKRRRGERSPRRPQQVVE